LQVGVGDVEEAVMDRYVGDMSELKNSERLKKRKAQKESD